MFSTAKFCLTISLFALVDLYQIIEPSLSPTPNLTGLIRRKRIIGGNPADPSQYRFMVFVFWIDADDGMTCCGTLFTRTMVITAGHCVSGKPANVPVQVDMGSEKYTMNEVTYDGVGVRISAKKTIVHPSKLSH